MTYAPPSPFVSVHMSPQPIVALDTTYGALFIGVIFAAILYGFTCVQTWYYFTHYSSDPWTIKLLVLVVLLSDTGHQVLITHAIYSYVITYFGVVEELGNIVWSVVGEVLFNGFTTLLVQCFLTMRVWKLSNKNYFMTGLIFALVLAEFLMSFVFGVRALQFDTWVQLSTLKVLSLAVNAAAAAGDLLIAVCLCYLLQRSRTGFRKSETMINRLIAFSINTGLLTSICALASLVSYVSWPKTFIYVTFYFCIGRLYCNSLLATLNARKALRGDSSNDMSLSLQGSSNHTKLATSSKRIPNNISIKIDTTHEYVRDEQYCSSGDVKEPEVV